MFQGIRSFFIAVVILTISAAGVQAQTWSVVSDYTPSGTAKTATTAAGGTFEGGWIDEYGNTWSSDSSKNLYTASTTNPWQAGIFERPSAEAAAASQRMRITFTQGKGDVYAYLLHNGQLAGNAQGYAMGVSTGNGLRIYTVVGGGLTQIGGVNFSSAPVSGTQYVIDAALVRNSDGTNSLTLTRYAADGTSQLDTLSVASDATAALKSASGRPATFAYLNGATAPGLSSYQRLVTYNAQAAPAVTTSRLTVDQPAWAFSPYNWKGDTGRGGSTYRQSWVVGSHFEVSWNASSSPTAIIDLTSASSVIVAYELNGVLTDNVAAAQIDVSSATIPSAVNTLRVTLRSSPQSARWNNGANTLQVKGLLLDTASSGGTAPTYTGYDVFYADSLGEGIGAADGSANFLKAFSFYYSQATKDAGRNVGMNVCGNSDLIRPGDDSGDVPALYMVSNGTYVPGSSRWQLVDSGVSVLDANGQFSAYGATNTMPVNAIMVYGTNAALNNLSTSDERAAVKGWMTAMRAASPPTRIVVVVPFGLYATAVMSNGPTYAAAIKGGFADYQAANPGDSNILLVDFGPTFSATLTSSFYGGAVVHGNSAMHAREAARFIPKIMGGAANTNTPAAVAAPSFRYGFH